jgi:hypothetical protein
MEQVSQTRLLIPDTLLTPPPTRQQTPESQTLLSSPNRRLKTIPSWAVVVIQLSITMPLYIFAFWLVIEGIKASGDIVITTIDYLAFQP